MRRRVIQPGGLGDLAKARRAHAAAEARFRREILFAHLAGSSLRAIASAAGLSPESVRTIIRQENAKREAVKARLARELPADDMRRLNAENAQTQSDRERATRRRLAAEWRLSVQELDT